MTPVVMLLSGTLFWLHAQVNTKGEIPQYLFPEFTKCEVLMKTGQINNAMLNYNMVTEKMVFISNSKYYDLTNTDMTDTVRLKGSRFVPVGRAFYEVLVTGPITLYIQHRGTLMLAGKPVGYGGTSQTAASTYISSIELSGMQYNLTLPSEYVVNPSSVYWIRIGEKWSDFTTVKQFLSLFPDKSQQIKSFIKENRIKIDKPDSIAKLVRYCSSL